MTEYAESRTNARLNAMKGRHLEGLRTEAKAVRQMLDDVQNDLALGRTPELPSSSAWDRLVARAAKLQAHRDVVEIYESSVPENLTGGRIRITPLDESGESAGPAVEHETKAACADHPEQEMHRFADKWFCCVCEYNASFQPEPDDPPEHVTERGCTLTVIDAPEELGEGVLLRMRMKQVGGGRFWEVYLAPEDVRWLREVLQP